jgi:O-antigen/teichoic acid export membrane protein
MFHETMPISTEILKNSIWNFILFASYGITGVSTSVLAARYLGPELMGEYSFIIWLMGIMAVLAGIGFPNTITKFISELIGSGDKNSAEAVYAKLTHVQLITALVITILLIGIFYPSLSPVQKDYYLIAFLSLTPLCMSTFITCAFHGVQNFKITSIVGSIVNLLQLILVIVSILLDMGLKGLLLVPLMSSMVHVLLLWKYIPFRIMSPFKIPKEYRSKIIKYTLSLYWIVILSVIVWQKLEVFFLKIYSTSGEIAFYSIALNITMLMIGFTSLFSTVIFPVFSSYWGAGDGEGIQNVYNKSIKAIVIFYLPICIIFIAVSKPIVLLMYSSDYLTVSPLLIILMVSSLFFALGVLLTNLIQALNRVDIIIKYVTLLAVINIIFDLILIPKYGAVGAAMANSSVRIMVLPFWIWIIKKKLGFSFPTRDVFICVLPNIPLTIILCLIGNRYPNLLGIFLVVFIAILIYPLLLFLFRTITSDDIRTVREASTILPAPYEKMMGAIFDRIPIK